MATEFPIIDENMTADIPRDMNALAGAIRNDIGIMDDLTTTDQTSLVNAINEVKADVDNIVIPDLDAHLADGVNHVPYAADTGTANVKAVTLNPEPAAYVEGMAVSFKNKTDNTGAVTINVNALGAKAILKSNGNALASGNLKANSIYTLRYNGANFILQGEGGEYGSATAGDVRSTKNTGTDTGLVTGTLVTQSATAQTITPGTTDIVMPPGIYDGAITIKGDPDKIPGNIKNGVNIDGVGGIAYVVEMTLANPAQQFAKSGSNNTATFTTAASVTFNLSGSARIEVLLNGSVGTVSSGRLYRNGVLIADESTLKNPVNNAATIPLTFTDLKRGDVFRLDIKSSSTSQASGQLTVFYDEPPSTKPY